MKTILKVIATATLAVSFLANTQAAVINVSMTADNIVSGGLCVDTTCTSIDSNWSDFGSMTNSTEWKLSDTVSFNLNPGIYGFAWLVENTGSGSSGNPAALLAEVSVDGNAVFSSADWEVFDNTTGAFIANATEYGANGQIGLIWTNAVGGPISGISTNANWIYSANNFANADSSAWIRTIVEVQNPVNNVSAPSLIVFATIGALFLAGRRKA